MKISTNKYVTLSYDLFVGEGDDIELKERATAENPLDFIFGTSSMLEAFEKNLEGLTEGDSFDFIISPEDTKEEYGEYSAENVHDLPRHLFLKDGKMVDDVFVGNVIQLMTTDGQRLPGVVLEVNDEFVKVDVNHPFAGETLNFKGKILTVRESTAEEIAALFAPHGCGCGSCGCGGEEEDSCGCGNHDEKEMAGGCGSGCGCH